jgi:hypothetical protein
MRLPLAALIAVALGRPGLAVAAGTVDPITVWKDPNCGCCKDWVRHLRANGFRVTVDDTGNARTRARLGVPEKLGGCHTALIAGYAVEGHVPARDLLRLLKERPAAIGLVVPGMPVGSPGMDGPEYGGRREPFDVLLIKLDGSTQLYQSYNRA